MAQRLPETALDALFPGELNNNIGASNRRLIRMRWVAGMLVLAATAVGVHGLGLPLPEWPLYAVGFWVLAYNALLVWLTTRLDARPAPERPIDALVVGLERRSGGSGGSKILRHAVSRPDA